MIRKLFYLLFYLTFLLHSCIHKDDLIGDYSNDYGQKLSIKKNHSYHLFNLDNSLTTGRWEIVDNGRVLFYDWGNSSNNKGNCQVTFKNEILWFSLDEYELNFRKMKLPK
jgi:hypothetical protein